MCERTNELGICDHVRPFPLCRDCLSATCKDEQELSKDGAQDAGAVGKQEDLPLSDTVLATAVLHAAYVDDSPQAVPTILGMPLEEESLDRLSTRLLQMAGHGLRQLDLLELIRDTLHAPRADVLSIGTYKKLSGRDVISLKRMILKRHQLRQVIQLGNRMVLRRCSFDGHDLYSAVSAKIARSMVYTRKNVERGRITDDDLKRTRLACPLISGVHSPLTKSACTFLKKKSRTRHARDREHRCDYCRVWIPEHVFAWPCDGCGRRFCLAHYDAWQGKCISCADYSDAD